MSAIAPDLGKDAGFTHVFWSDTVAAMPMSSPEPAEDAQVAQALRRSLVVLVALGVIAAGAIWWLTRGPGSSPVNQATRSQTAGTNVPAPPHVLFANITREAGIHFRHINGARGEKLLPETMGGGVAFFDFDNDGDQDLLFVNSNWWPGQQPPGEPAPTTSLYANDGHGHFKDVSAGSGLDVSFYGMGAAVGDFDNDGLVDVLLTGIGGNRLFRNLGDGRFGDVTSAAGVAGNRGDWTTAAAWIDIDNDGDLDLFVGNYVAWTPELDRQVNNQLVGLGRAYGRPWNYPTTLPHLYRNDGGGHFTDVSEQSGLQVRHPTTGLPMAKTLAVAPIDLNDDGWIDLVVANDTVQNFVFTNRHNGTFREIGAQSGIAFDAYGQARGAMGIDAARFRNDDTLGIAIGNFANEMNALYVSQATRPGSQLLFADEAAREGLGPASQALLKFGLFFFDYDLDGRLDVLTANGHLDEDVEKVQPGARYRQPAQLFWNAGGRQTFVEVRADRCGPDLFQPIAGRGSAFADIDGDGDLDIVMTQVNGPPLLLRNDQNLGHHWLRLKLVGNRANRDAIGAWIRVRIGGTLIARQVMPTRSYLSQSELPVTIGLGSASRVDEVSVVWPDGSVQKLPNLPLDRLSVVTQPK
jgi:hypothetical protein